MPLLFPPKTPDPLLRIAGELAQKVDRERIRILKTVQMNPRQPVEVAFLFLDPNGGIRECSGRRLSPTDGRRQSLMVMQLHQDLVALLQSRPPSAAPCWRWANQHMYPPCEVLPQLIWAWLWADNFEHLLEAMSPRELLIYKRALIEANDPAANDPAIHDKLRNKLARHLAKPKLRPPP